MCSQNNNALGCQDALAGPLSEIQTWLVHQFHLAHGSLNRLYDAEQIDLWPFLRFGTDIIDLNDDCDSDRPELFNHIAAALEIFGPTALYDQLSQDTDVQLSDQMVILCKLLLHIPSWLASTDLLGDFALTGERHAVAFLHTLRFLVRLPAVQFTQVLVDAHQHWEGFSASIILARRAVYEMLPLIPHTEELYFLVLFLCSEIMARPPPHWQEYDDAWDREGIGLFIDPLIDNGRHYLATVRLYRLVFG